ncbi:DUF3999 family protein [Leucothrix sargassi]|nr:DUF3999 family protein [Leucothrix sargassi]
MFKCLLPLALGVVALSHVATAEVKPDDFHFKATLSEGTSSLRQVELPWPVVSSLMQKDFKDLRVFNGEQQAVPFEIRPIQSVRESTIQRTLNFFPTDEMEKLGTVLQKEAGDESFKAIKLLQAGQRQLIIENPKVDTKEALPLQRLTLGWEGLTHLVPKSLKVDVSDDLIRWNRVAISELPYRLTQGDAVLENQILAFERAVTQRFIRLSGVEDFTPLIEALQSVKGEYSETRQLDNLRWNSVELRPTSEKTVFEYDLSPSLAIKEWRFDELSAGSLVRGNWLASRENRSHNKQREWRLIRSFLQYSLQTEAGLVSSPSVKANIYDVGDVWRFDFQQSFSEDKNPTLALAWKPMALVFVAQGSGPFEIRYANSEISADGGFVLDDLLSKLEPESVKVLETFQTSEVVGKNNKEPYKYLLWALLFAAVLMLLFMAKRLLNDMDSK